LWDLQGEVGDLGVGTKEGNGEPYGAGLGTRREWRKQTAGSSTAKIVRLRRTIFFARNDKLFI